MGTKLKELAERETCSVLPNSSAFDAQKSQGEDVEMTVDQPGFSFDLAFAPKTNVLTEKFILDLLFLPESIAHPGKDTLEASSIPLSCDNSDISADNSEFSRSWGQNGADHAVTPEAGAGSLQLSEMETLPESGAMCKEEYEIPSQPESLQGEKREDELSRKSTAEGKEDMNGMDCARAGGNAFKEVRSRRRREFHKIHTRRSRAKLNEKMDLLRRILPEPPTGIVVKSKAQIIDYAITVLARLPLKGIDSEYGYSRRD